MRKGSSNSQRKKRHLQLDNSDKQSDAELSMIFDLVLS